MPDTPEPAAPLGLLLCDDLIFISRVTGTARALGLVIQSARSSAALEALACQQPPTGVLVDLANPGLLIAELIGRLREVCPRPPRVVAYGSHVDTQTLRAACAAGCDVVLPRSQFVADLPQALPEWLSPSRDAVKK